MPWGPWLLSVTSGVIFVLIAALNLASMPLWARLIFLGLGVIAPLTFLSYNAAVRAVFDRPGGVVTITRTRPIGGTSEQVVPLTQIAAVDQIVQTDADGDQDFRFEPVLTGSKRVSISSGRYLCDQSEERRRLTLWLGLPAN